MRLPVKLTLLLLLPLTLFAQSIVTLKKQANNVAKALASGDYNTVAAAMYPKAVKQAGGKQKVIQLLSSAADQLKASGLTLQSVTIGEPGKLYKAGTEIHCLIPQNIRIKTANGSFANQSNLLAVSPDGGKNWKFLELNKSTVASIPKMFPNFNNNLKIPQPKTTGL